MIQVRILIKPFVFIVSLTSVVEFISSALDALEIESRTTIKLLCYTKRSGNVPSASINPLARSPEPLFQAFSSFINLNSSGAVLLSLVSHFLTFSHLCQTFGRTVSVPSACVSNVDWWSVERWVVKAVSLGRLADCTCIRTPSSASIQVFIHETRCRLALTGWQFFQCHPVWHLPLQEQVCMLSWLAIWFSMYWSTLFRFKGFLDCSHAVYCSFA